MTTLIDDDPNSYFCFSHGELASCWYVLLSGAVFIQVSFMMRKLVKVNHRWAWIKINENYFVKSKFSLPGLHVSSPYKVRFYTSFNIFQCVSMYLPVKILTFVLCMCLRILENSFPCNQFLSSPLSLATPTQRCRWKLETAKTTLWHRSKSSVVLLW